jgi:tRNA G46 methylase TrmB
LRISDLLGSLERVIATSQIQGLGFTLQKVKEKALFEAGLKAENAVVPVIRRLAESHRHATYVDIGAYDGDTTVLVAQLFDCCLAVEPHPDSFKRLQDNLKRHGLRNTIVIRCAVRSDISEQVLYSAEMDDNSRLTLLNNSRQREKVHTWLYTM